MSNPHYTVVWSGASRTYLFVTDPPKTDHQTDPPQTPSQTAPDLSGWTSGAHLRPYDLPRLRLRSSLLTAPGAFSIHELAQAAQVSVTRARSYVAEQVEAGTVRPVGTRPTGARAGLFERV